MLENEIDLLTPIVQNDQNNIDMKANIQNIQQNSLYITVKKMFQKILII